MHDAISLVMATFKAPSGYEFDIIPKTACIRSNMLHENQSNPE